MVAARRAPCLSSATPGEDPSARPHAPRRSSPLPPASSRRPRPQGPDPRCAFQVSFAHLPLTPKTPHGHPRRPRFSHNRHPNRATLPLKVDASPRPPLFDIPMNQPPTHDQPAPPGHHHGNPKASQRTERASKRHQTGIKKASFRHQKGITPASLLSPPPPTGQVQPNTYADTPGPKHVFAARTHANAHLATDNTTDRAIASALAGV